MRPNDYGDGQSSPTFLTPKGQRKPLRRRRLSFTYYTASDGIVGNYGDREAYTRVSAFTVWIDKTVREK